MAPKLRLGWFGQVRYIGNKQNKSYYVSQNEGRGPFLDQTQNHCISYQAIKYTLFETSIFSLKMNFKQNKYEAKKPCLRSMFEFSPRQFSFDCHIHRKCDFSATSKPDSPHQITVLMLESRILHPNASTFNLQTIQIVLKVI